MAVKRVRHSVHMTSIITSIHPYSSPEPARTGRCTLPTHDPHQVVQHSNMHSMLATVMHTLLVATPECHIGSCIMTTMLSGLIMHACCLAACPAGLLLYQEVEDFGPRVPRSRDKSCGPVSPVWGSIRPQKAVGTVAGELPWWVPLCMAFMACRHARLRFQHRRRYNSCLPLQLSNPTAVTCPHVQLQIAGRAVDAVQSTSGCCTGGAVLSHAPC